MKKLNTSVSPFIMLLLPIFLIIGLLVVNINTEIPAEKFNTSLNLQVPSFKAMVQCLF
ncbi:MAG TPA: hypothetical protein VEV16_06495 [Daejeonella sp.]|nr:hypothetical protein [Daejeonella sp.]